MDLVHVSEETYTVKLTIKRSRLPMTLALLGGVQMRIGCRGLNMQLGQLP
jgi:hypothetical protein